MSGRQQFLDEFYWSHGPCCAGCDWWRSINSRAGECIKSAPVSGETKYAMLGMRGCSMQMDAGHVLTFRDHACGDFKDDFDWSSLPPHYLRQIGHPQAPKR